jgi:hypothetical protein
MSTATAHNESRIGSDTGRASKADMKFEVAVLPVEDVDRAKRFYTYVDVGTGAGAAARSGRP